MGVNRALVTAVCRFWPIACRRQGSPKQSSSRRQLFGARYLVTLFGLTLLSHRLGGCFGAWVGGLVMERFGDYTWMWYADMALALVAAVANLPIRESRPVLQPATA
ncbi:hypothetical protein J2X06_001979 [Lysobacter niastensis]|uniref:MFS transporter n=1 Tax=Lysobacter niastensis TaxID=380629 RepID=A0ABU1WBQ1_9GAMM|nr:hypothetical protein [Lysobacter niastensis]MDR7134770.1 hypothetical protein [Lysobacter niastensis]